MKNTAEMFFNCLFGVFFVIFFFLFGISGSAAETTCKAEVSDFIFDLVTHDSYAAKKTTQGYVKFSCSNLSQDTVYVNACLKGPVKTGDSSNFYLSSPKINEPMFAFYNSFSGLSWSGFSSPLNISMMISPQSVVSQKIPLSVEMNYDPFDFPSGLLSSSFILPAASLSWNSTPSPHDTHCNVSSANESITFNVRANLLNICDAYASDIDFGKIFETPISNVTSRGSIFVKCTNGAIYNLSLRSLNGGIDRFIMKNSKGDNLKYTLYKNPERTLLWGNGVNSKYGTGNGKSQQHFVYGIINLPPKYSPPPGEFKDTVIISITY
ncbi:Csu type fimbrial protein [Enterobacter ludwigii]|uniref:Csu type fimbrial protein n=1 Tax=Enterobacter ludwigii TaxID=299767 RepID=UPI00273EFD16|nr:spore coat U domain-containing protein [Enterobacter ludwigii]MDP5163385.1 spore coat U domain-containing protein [Enterobacter ludwigii]